jgi:acyl-CoA synthetase (AMP-forming)/AMP-acid ligase II
MCLHEHLEMWARRAPHAVMAKQDHRRWSFDHAAAAIGRLAGAMVDAGLRVGDRVAVLSKNRFEFVLLYYAASKAGVVLVPLNYRLAPTEWAYILADARPRVLFAEPQYAAPLDGLRQDLGWVERFVGMTDEPMLGWESLKAWMDGPVLTARASFGDDADALQLYTSATTGRPKGAVLTHRALTASIERIGEAQALRPGERSLAVAPIFHVGVVPTVFTAIARGACAVLQEEFNPAAVVRTLDEQRIAVAVLVPSMLQACLANVAAGEERRYETLRLIYYGASPIAEPTLRTAMQVFGCGFMQSYGLTETTQAVTFLTPADHELALAGRADLLQSAGRAIPDTEIRIVDADGQPVPTGAPGEIVARGPQMMRAYWNMPEETEETLRDGWVHTGDIGRLDEEGYLFVLDRLKDMIVSGGENVYPRAVEDVLLAHPAVVDAVVIGVPDARWGETVKGVLVLKEGYSANEAELIAHCRQRLGGFEIPRSIDFVESLPRNATGKVLKRVLREQYWTGEQRRVAGA